MPSSLASTPPLGWKSWNTFGNYINDSVVRETANVLISMGLKDHSYNCIIVGNPQTIHAVKNH